MLRSVIISVFMAAALISVSSHAQGLRGTFSSAASVIGSKPAGVNLQFGMNSSSTMRMSAAEREAIPHNGSFRVALDRDAGTVVLEGTSMEGRVAGHYTFRPSASFVPSLQKRGVRVSSPPATEEMLLMAAIGLDLEYVDELARVGFSNLHLSRLRDFAIHRVTAPWIRSLREAGYALSEEEAVDFRIHRVSSELISAYASHGYENLSRKDVMSMAIHRVTPGYIEEMRAAGLGDLPASKLVELKIHKVTPEYVRALESLGYRGLPAQKLVEMRIHRVDADFIRRVNARTGSITPADKLIRMRIHRIDPEELR